MQVGAGRPCWKFRFPFSPHLREWPDFAIEFEIVAKHLLFLQITDAAAQPTFVVRRGLFV